jgi:hypothetical protein
MTAKGKLITSIRKKAPRQLRSLKLVIDYFTKMSPYVNGTEVLQLKDPWSRHETKIIVEVIGILQNQRADLTNTTRPINKMG